MQWLKTSLVAAWLAASLLWRSFLSLFEGSNSMADPNKTEAQLLETLKAKIDASPVSAAPPTVGHRPPFGGDLTVIGHCAKVAYDEIGAGNYTSETLHTHLAQGYGEAAVLGLEDEPTPVGAAAGLPGWLTLFLNLILLIGEKQ
jgi:hypothetical protein